MRGGAIGAANLAVRFAREVTAPAALVDARIERVGGAPAPVAR